MGVVKLGDVARESRLKWTKSKQDVPIVGLNILSLMKYVLMHMI